MSKQDTGTRVVISIGGDRIPAMLNDTTTAREFIKTLPFSVIADRGEFDFCGTATPLPVDETETQAGWKDGDIGYSRGWFALFHAGQGQSHSYPSERIIGHVDEGQLDAIRGHHGSVRITVEASE